MVFTTLLEPLVEHVLPVAAIAGRDLHPLHVPGSPICRATDQWVARRTPSGKITGFYCF